mmetsp:Transcript_15673/g.37427  ORF Transcript_15673/g.37427 Transcript_15673/m.37427 type:complete len:248 (+) Transcript_15673:417-1160(+)
MWRTRWVQTELPSARSRFWARCTTPSTAMSARKATSARRVQPSAKSAPSTLTPTSPEPLSASHAMRLDKQEGPSMPFPGPPSACQRSHAPATTSRCPSRSATGRRGPRARHTSSRRSATAEPPPPPTSRSTVHPAIRACTGLAGKLVASTAHQGSSTQNRRTRASRRAQCAQADKLPRRWTGSTRRLGPTSSSLTSRAARWPRAASTDSAEPGDGGRSGISSTLVWAMERWQISGCRWKCGWKRRAR